LKKLTFNLLIDENLRPDAKEIKKPVLILWGTKDRLTKVQDAYWLSKNIPTSTLKIFQNEPHTLPYRKPEEVAKLIDQWAAK
jgi:pimeloyl-ACP methyl ester carboxylesterase